MLTEPASKFAEEPVSMLGRAPDLRSSPGALGRLRAKSHPQPGASFSGSKAFLDNLHGIKNVRRKELVGKNTPDVTEVCTQQHGIHTQTSWALFQTQTPQPRPSHPHCAPFFLLRSGDVNTVWRTGRHEPVLPLVPVQTFPEPERKRAGAVTRVLV